LTRHVGTTRSTRPPRFASSEAAGEDIGPGDFYPFDLLAAAYAGDPNLFRCAQLNVWVGEDDQLPVWSLQSQASLLSQEEIGIDAATPSGRAL
jgi:hypothetical protein